jgi:5-enolpyruvylshikimate-3-phosphate synthase
VVDDARSVRTSFPAFVETFRGLGMRIEEARGEPA